MAAIQDPVVLAGAGAGEGVVGRRSWLTATATAVGAVAVAAVVPGAAVEAATPTVKLGVTNTIGAGTTIKDSAHSSSAKALTGRTTYTGTSTNAAGVQGISDGKDGNGVIGTASNGVQATGVWGRSAAGAGVYGSGPIGVVGAGVGGTDTVGVLGLGADDGIAVSAIGGTTVDSTGLYAAVAGDGWAAFIDGDLLISGDMYAPTLTMTVDHPDAPRERWYQQAAVGSFERLSILTGNARTGADGTAVVNLPDLFARMHRDFRYQLTVIGSPASAHIARELRQGRFIVRTDRPRVKVSWQVTAVRDDPSARATAFHPSVRKTGRARGRLMEPAVYGGAASRAIGTRIAASSRRQGDAMAGKRASFRSED